MSRAPSDRGHRGPNKSETKFSQNRPLPAGFRGNVFVADDYCRFTSDAREPRPCRGSVIYPRVGLRRRTKQLSFGDEKGQRPICDRSCALEASWRIRRAIKRDSSPRISYHRRLATEEALIERVGGDEVMERVRGAGPPRAALMGPTMCALYGGGATWRRPSPQARATMKMLILNSAICSTKYNNNLQYHISFTQDQKLLVIMNVPVEAQ